MTGLGSDVHGEREQAATHQGRAERPERVRQLRLREVDERVPGRDRRPARRRPRPQQSPQVADLEREARVPQLRLGDHARRHVDAGDLEAVGGEVRGHVSGAGAHVDHGRGASGVCRDPVEQPRVEGLVCELVAVVVGVGLRHDVVRLRDLGIPRRRALGQRRLAIGRGHRCDLARGQRSEQVHPTPVLLARPKVELADEAPFGHRPQRGLDIGALREPVQTLGPGPQLAGRLSPAQEQHGQQRTLTLGELDGLVQRLRVLHRSRPRRPHEPYEVALLQPAQHLVDLGLRPVHDRVAARGLVARGPYGVERQWVRRRHRDHLLQQAPEHALLPRVEYGQVHGRHSRDSAWEGTGECSGVDSDPFPDELARHQPGERLEGAPADADPPAYGARSHTGRTKGALRRATSHPYRRCRTPSVTSHP